MKVMEGRNGKFRRGFRPEKTAKLKAFTLIEALATIAIIGVLATLSIYIYTTASMRGRDARRKADLTAISLSFQARYDAQTCSNPADVGYYPGRSFSPTKWKVVSDLMTLSDDCGAFSEYLATVPANPADPQKLFPYRYDLSTKSPEGLQVAGKYYRLAARLESVQSLQQQSDLDRIMTVWTESFGGSALPPTGKLGQNYNYVIGR